mmetsp:Transcript_11301/g.16097  ORF Transcript_11301/g.16097 Transcript_11301/m.16097 type:complete len:231 (-) Transcript_11301:374-1066(-)
MRASTRVNCKTICRTVGVKWSTPIIENTAVIFPWGVGMDSVRLPSPTEISIEESIGLIKGMGRVNIVGRMVVSTKDNFSMMFVMAKVCTDGRMVPPIKVSFGRALVKDTENTISREAFIPDSSNKDSIMATANANGKMDACTKANGRRVWHTEKEWSLIDTAKFCTRVTGGTTSPLAEPSPPEAEVLDKANNSNCMVLSHPSSTKPWLIPKEEKGSSVGPSTKERHMVLV